MNEKRTRKQTNRLQSVYLLNYINNSSSVSSVSLALSSSISSDDDIVEIVSNCSSNEQNSNDIDHDEFVKSFQIAFDSLFAQISHFDQTRFMEQFVVKTIQENYTFSNDDNALILVLSPNGCFDAHNGRMYSSGSIINIETFIFNTTHNPYTIMTTDTPINIAELSSKHFSEFTTIRNIFIRTRFSVLSVLTDDELNSVGFDYRWITANTDVELNNELALLVDGKVYNNTKDNVSLPGSIIGVSEYMGRTVSSIHAITQHVGIAIINKDDFEKLMQNPSFNDAIYEISFEHTVFMENETVVNEEVSDLDHNSLSSDDTCTNIISPPQKKTSFIYTTTLKKTIDKHEKFHINQYLLDTQIGSGSYSKIFKTDNRVLKLVERKLSKHCIERELAALHTLQHTNIIELYECIDCADSTIFIFVLELCDHGSLFDVIVPIHECKIICTQILDALYYIHSIGYIHNDIKPSNILRTSNHVYKLCDFGSCTKAEEGGIKFSTPSFQSPESFSDGTCALSDVWAFSVSIYNLMYGRLPFSNQHDRSLYECIQFSPLTFPAGGEINENNIMIKDFISSGLEKDIADRASVQTLQRHQFLLRKKHSGIQKSSK
jgi:hypothetical protein